VEKKLNQILGEAQINKNEKMRADNKENRYYQKENKFVFNKEEFPELK